MKSPLYKPLYPWMSFIHYPDICFWQSALFFICIQVQIKCLLASSFINTLLTHLDHCLTLTDVHILRVLSKPYVLNVCFLAWNTVITANDNPIHVNRFSFLSYYLIFTGLCSLYSHIVILNSCSAPLFFLNCTFCAAVFCSCTDVYCRCSVFYFKFWHCTLRRSVQKRNQHASPHYTNMQI